MDFLRDINQSADIVESILLDAEYLLTEYAEQHNGKFSIHETEADHGGSIEWDPEMAKREPGAGKPITKDTGVARRRGISPKDLVVKQDDKGKMLGVGVVGNIDREGVHVNSRGNLFTGSLSTGAFQQADKDAPAIRKLQDKYPGTRIWVVGGEEQWALPGS